MYSWLTRLTALSISSGLFAAVSIGACQAQAEYPAHPIRFVVPVPPGPSIDAISRAVAQQLSAKIGQPVVVENRPGAAQNLGAEAVANSQPDGYTFLSTPPAPLVASKHLYPKLRFDPAALVPVSVVATFPTALVVRADLSVSSLPELIDYAKKNPGNLSYGSPGLGSTPQLAMERIVSAADIKLIHVAYQGMAPAMNDLLGGHIDVMLDLVGNVMPHVKSGKLKLLAAVSRERLKEMSQIPTVSETLPGISHDEWVAIVAPPKTPAMIVEKISKAVDEIVKSPEFEKKLREFSAVPVGGSPAEAAAFIRNISDSFEQIIKAKGIKIE